MPEHVGTLRPPSRQARAIDHVGHLALNGLDQSRHVVRVILHVRILYHDDVPTAVRDAVAQSRALATVGLAEQMYLSWRSRMCHDDVGGRVRRSVVDDDRLVVKIEHRDAIEYLGDCSGLVVRGNDECDQH
jgi:hypothetical protein